MNNIVFLSLNPVEYIGIAAGVIVLLSFLFKKIKVIRLVNIVGAILFVIYGLLLPTYSTAFVNFALIVVHIIYLIRDELRRRKKATQENLDQ
jgi:membrane protein implicated in regulation of membrane protease activity